MAIAHRRDQDPKDQTAPRVRRDTKAPFPALAHSIRTERTAANPCMRGNAPMRPTRGQTDTGREQPVPPKSGRTIGKFAGIPRSSHRRHQPDTPARVWQIPLLACRVVWSPSLCARAALRALVRHGRDERDVMSEAWNPPGHAPIGSLPSFGFGSAPRSPPRRAPFPSCGR